MAEPRVIPVAVIGMACRLPGGIDSPEHLWEALLRGDDLVTEIPADRWDADEYYDPEPGVPGRSVSKWGAFLDDVAGFDAEFFGIGEREATSIDPQHRLLLETAWEAIEHAGLDPRSLAGSQTGVFIGLTHYDYTLIAAEANALEGPYGFTGNDFSLASGRIAYSLGAHGPAFTVDSACSSGLLRGSPGLPQPARAARATWRWPAAASVMLEPRRLSSASAQGMLSPTGRCHAFDVDADGFVRCRGRRHGAAQATARRSAGRRPDPGGDPRHRRQSGRPHRTSRCRRRTRRSRSIGRRWPRRHVDPTRSASSRLTAPAPRSAIRSNSHSLAGFTAPRARVRSDRPRPTSDTPNRPPGALGLMKAVLALQHGVVPQNLHFTRLPDELAEDRDGPVRPDREHARGAD